MVRRNENAPNIRQVWNWTPAAKVAGQINLIGKYSDQMKRLFKPRAGFTMKCLVFYFIVLKAILWLDVTFLSILLSLGLFHCQLNS